MAKATLPTLNRDNGGSSLDDVELERVAESKSDAIVDLEARNESLPTLTLDEPWDLHPSAIGAPRCREAQDKRKDRHPCEGAPGERSAGCASLRTDSMSAEREDKDTFHVPVMMGTAGRYFEMRRAVLPLVERTMMALAFCSAAAATAAIATVSAV